LAEANGHTEIVVRVNEQAQPPVMVTSATAPRKTYTMIPAMYTASKQPAATDGGFLRFRWPQVSSNGKVTLLDGKEHPHYSTEEYDPAFMNSQTSFDIAVFKKINPNFSFYLVFSGALDFLKTKIQSRVDIVNQGFEACKKIDCKEGTQGYEDWSTP